MRLSQTYADFSSELATVLAYATANALRLGVIYTQITALTVASAAWMLKCISITYCYASPII